MGISIGGSFEAYVVTVDGNGSITVTPYSSTSGGIATLQPGQKGAIIHLRNSERKPIIWYCSYCS